MLSAEQRTLMNLILQKKSTEALAHLKEYPSMDVNFVVSMQRHNLHNFSPLMMAANFAQAEVVLELLKRKALVSATDLTGKTALHYAVGGGALTAERKQSIFCLIYAKRDLLTTADSFGNMPIHIAAFKGAIAIADYLLRFEPNLKFCLQEKTKKTPLQVYVQENKAPVPEMLKLLGEEKKIPSLQFLCLKMIGASRDIREETPGLPECLQDDVKVFTPTLTKYLEKRAQDHQTDDADEITEKLRNVSLRS